jgi:hypothetical protein
LQLRFLSMFFTQPILHVTTIEIATRKSRDRSSATCSGVKEFCSDSRGTKRLKFGALLSIQRHHLNPKYQNARVV